jgi:hypothetical protein
MKQTTTGAPAPRIRRQVKSLAPLVRTAVPKSGLGKRNINTLKRLLDEVGQWAEENRLHDLAEAMRDAYGLIITCWTEGGDA